MINIKWTEIKIDIDKLTWRLAKVKIGDPEMRSDAQEDVSKTSMTFVMRLAETAFAIVSAKISEQLVSSNAAETNDAIDMTKAEWTFTLKNNSNVNERVLALLIHRFMVAYIMYYWALMWAQDSASQFKADSDEALSSIQSEVFALSTPKKKLFPSEYEISNPTEIEYECN